MRTDRLREGSSSGREFDRIFSEGKWLAELLAGTGVDRIAMELENLFWFRPYFAFVSVPVGKSLPLPLGCLAESWRKGRLLSACPRCGGRSYVMGAEARLFSARGRWFGVCPDCRSAVSGHRPGPLMLWRLALAWGASMFRGRNRC